MSPVTEAEIHLLMERTVQLLDEHGLHINPYERDRMSLVMRLSMVTALEYALVEFEGLG